MSTADSTATRPIRLAGALLLVLPLAACTTGDPGSPAAVASTPAAASVQSGSPSPDPSASATGGGREIDADALLRPSDVGGAEPEPVAEGELGHLRPLRPCGTNAAYPSDDSRTAAVAVRYVTDPQGGQAPTVLVEFLGRHAPGGAAEQFDDIADALRRCPGGLGENQRRWTVLDTGVAGDESILVRIQEKMTYGDETPSTVSDYAAVARAGDMIVVVTDTGWENIDSSEKLVRDLIGKAVERAGRTG